MITNYDELKTQIASWLKRPDLATDVPTMVQLAEAEFNEDLVTTEMETRSQATTEEEFIGLPSDFEGIRTIHIEGSPDTTLQYLTPQEFTRFEQQENRGAAPCVYTILDSQIKLYPAPTIENPASLEIIYLQSLQALSDSNTTNWLLDKHPNVYLWGSLVNAEAFIHNDKRIGLWKSRYNEAIHKINKRANKKRLGAGPLRPKVKNVI